jgi:hypothetical protein
MGAKSRAPPIADSAVRRIASLNIRRRVPGPEHPATLNSMNNLERRCWPSIKAGVDLDVKLTKGIKLEGEIDSGAHIAGPGNDPDTTAKVVVPIEGIVWLKANF